MADIAQLEKALINADAAGDANAARAFAAEITRIRQGTPRATGTIDPTEGMSNAQKLLAGAGKAFVDVGRGVGQLIGAVSKEDIDKARELEAPLMNTTAGNVGNVVGNLAAYAPLAFVPGANTVAGSALIGGASGAIQPTGTGESAIQNSATGAIAGAAIPAAARILKGAKAALVDPFTQSGRDRIAGGVLNRAASSPSSVNNISSSTGSTPGFLPTVGQASNDAGLASFERTMRAINPGAFDQVDKNQRAALANALLSIAKTPEEKFAASVARSNAAESLYKEALNPENQQPLTPWLKGQITQLLKRPSINDASKTAQRWAIERGERPSSTGSMAALHDVKKSLDDAISKATREGLGGEVAALSNTKEKLLSVIEKVSPKYKEARETYAAMSKPINQMDIGQSLYNKFEPALSQAATYPFKITAENLARAVQNGDSLAKSVTGFSGAKLADILTPEQLNTVHGVIKDSAMRAAAENIGRGVGSDTVQKISMSHLANEAGVPNWLSSVARVPGGWMKRAGDVLYGNADEQIRNRLAEILTNPNEAAKLMQSKSLPPSKLAEALRVSGQGAAFSLPALNNQ